MKKKHFWGRYDKKYKTTYSFEAFYYIAVSSNISIETRLKEILLERGYCLDERGNEMDISNVEGNGFLASVYLISDAVPLPKYRHLFARWFRKRSGFFDV